MTYIKKFVILQKLSLTVSIIAICLSIFSIISVNKIKNSLNENINVEQKFKPIRDIPDVEIIKSDGTISTITAKTSTDELSKLMSSKNNTNKQNNNISDKKNNNENENQQEKNIKEQKLPVSRTLNNNKELKNITKNTDNNIKQDVKINTEITKKQEIYGNFVVQIGAYKDKNMAKNQCEKNKKYLNDKKCNVATTNNKIYRTIIYPFENNNEANLFVKSFQKQTNIICLIKKNIDNAS